MRSALRVVVALCAAGVFVAGGLSLFSALRPAPVGPRSAGPQPSVQDTPLRAVVPVQESVSLPPPTATVLPSTHIMAVPALHVAVKGAVAAPGLYEMPLASRVQHLIDEAGGLSVDADIGDINIAARLIDATTLVIPRKDGQGSGPGLYGARWGSAAAQVNPPFYTRSGWRPTAPASSLVPTIPAAVSAAPSGPSGVGLIDLNHATQEELERLPRIGPKTAEKIIAHRAKTPFRSVDDLVEVHGIGDKTLASLRALVTVE